MAAYAVVTLAVVTALEAGRPAGPLPGAAATFPAEMLQRFAVFTRGSYIAQLPSRFEDYTLNGIVLLPLTAPFIVSLFLLGALAGRLGWLTHPQRHPRVWRNARLIGWASAPAAAIGAVLNFVALRDTPGDPPYLGVAFAQASFGLMALYVAAIVAWRDKAPVAAAIRWLAPAGRMPLTNYLMQSLLMGLLLSGWGLGWGASLRHAELALLALGIVAAQIVASRAWMARFGQGPVEALWRRWTYPRVA
jgi:uncharacterized protein